MICMTAIIPIKPLQKGKSFLVNETKSFTTQQLEALNSLARKLLERIRVVFIRLISWK